MKILTIISLVTSLINPFTRDIVNDRLKNSTGYNGINNNLAQASYAYTAGDPSFSYGLTAGVVSGQYAFPLEYYLDITINFRQIVKYSNCSFTITFPATSNYYLNYVAVNCQITSANNSTNTISFNAYNTDVCTIRLVFTLECLHDNYNYDNPSPLVTDLGIPWVEHGYDYVDIVSFSMNNITYPDEVDYTSYIDNIEGYIDNLESILGNQYTELQDISDYLANISTNSTLINTTLSNIDTNITSVKSTLSTMSNYLWQLTNLTMYAADIENSSKYGLKKLPNDFILKREISSSGWNTYQNTTYSSDTIDNQRNSYIVVHLTGIRSPYEWFYMPIPYIIDSNGNPVNTYSDETRMITVYDEIGKYIYQLRFVFRKEFNSDVGFYIVKFRMQLYRITLSNSQNAASAISAPSMTSYMDHIYYGMGTFEPDYSIAYNTSQILDLLKEMNDAEYVVDNLDENIVEGLNNGLINNLEMIDSPTIPEKLIGTLNYFTSPYIEFINNPKLNIYKYGVLLSVIVMLFKVIIL